MSDAKYLLLWLKNFPRYFFDAHKKRDRTTENNRQQMALQNNFVAQQ